MTTASDADAIIVGSGASAVHAAWPLVLAGRRVRMLDVGNRDTKYEPLVPDSSFAQVRRTDPAQHRYFLGDELEGLPFDEVGTGAQLTPPRRFVAAETERLAPIASRTFAPLESLARGGLGGAWGAGVLTFAPEDLRGLPLPLAALMPHYEEVARRIGVSGARDDLIAVMGDLQSLQPPVRIDQNASALMGRYQQIRERLHRGGFRLGQARLAMLSQPLNGRRPVSYNDLDFWSDHGKSVYRPRWTLEELQARPGFEYCDRLLVETFRESAGRVQVVARDVRTGARTLHGARQLVLAAGALGTARIVLRSLELYDRRVPVVCNPHTYMPLLQWRRLGKVDREPRHSMAQLAFAQDDEPGREGSHRTIGHVFSYGTLLGFKLAKEMPLPLREGNRLAQLITTGLVILVLGHSDEPTERKWCALRREEGGQPERLEIEYALSPAEEARIERIEGRIVSAFRALGCTCLRRVHPRHGASIHYGGTLPMSVEPRELTTSPEGRLRGSQAVWIADGASFPRLPSRGLTFTLMANANRVGEQVVEALQ